MSQLCRVTAIAAFSLLLAGCSDSNYKATDTESVEEEPKNYEVTEYIDENGCEYLVVYTEKIGSNMQGVGVGAGITAKVNQPAACLENSPL